MNTWHLLGLVVASTTIAACRCNPGPAPGDAPPAPPSAAAPSSTAASAAPTHAGVAPVREGGALVRSVTGDALFLADEDHRAIRRIPLPLEDERTPEDAGTFFARDTPPAGMTTLDAPGAPAQLLALGDGRVLATIRDPGLLLILRADASGALVEEGRVPLPADAWGIAITPDEKIALVTSAWTHQVSAVDLATRTKRWSLDVAREPRGLAVHPDGRRAYVTHLVGATITRLDGIDGTAPHAQPVVLPPAPARAPSGKTLHASLGYAVALTPDGRRLFAARHALGALGEQAWFGAATVDALVTATDTPVLPVHTGGLPAVNGTDGWTNLDGMRDVKLPIDPFLQPRAMIYRHRSDTLLVAGEGDDLVAELDAAAPTPAIGRIRGHYSGAFSELTVTLTLGSNPPVQSSGVSKRGAAPIGLALSAEEDVLYVFCHGTYDLVALNLVDTPAQHHQKVIVRIAPDPLDGDGSIGRRLFYGGSDAVTSAGLGCAGCHPEGRDDGMVWHEAIATNLVDAEANFLGEPEQSSNSTGKRIGYPRQTPMLAGRVGTKGPFGWHAQNRGIL